MKISLEIKLDTRDGSESYFLYTIGYLSLNLLITHSLSTMTHSEYTQDVLKTWKFLDFFFYFSLQII